MVLSRAMLVTKYSNYKIIQKHVNKCFDFSMDLYNIEDLEDFHIVFKFKKVKVDISQLKRKFG